MGSLRFRRTVRIAPGIRLNVNKRSVGVSAGVRGARASINSDGRSTRSMGIPGTGLYYRSQTGLRSTRRTSVSPGAPAAMRPSRFFRRLIGWGAIALFVLLLLSGSAHAAGVVVAIGIVAWVLLWGGGTLFDVLFFALFGRRSRGAAAAPTLARGMLPTPPASPGDGELADANVPADWANTDAWLAWEAPQNLVAGESHYAEALRAFTGEPRPTGYLVAVEVRFVRERTNHYDASAWRAEVSGRHVGYARRHIAAQLSPVLDAHRCAEFTVCGVLRGGSPDAPIIGVHVWPARRPQPGPDLQIVDTTLAVQWPPSAGEGMSIAGVEPDRTAAELFDEYRLQAERTIANGGREDRALEFLKHAADIAVANDSAEQKAAAAAIAERLMKYARGTETLARAARIKKRLEPKARATRRTAETVEERLARLKELLDRGAITDGEYAAQRAAIIKQL